MFVRQSKYDEVLKDRAREQSAAVHWQIKYNLLNSKWNQLVALINKKGGQNFLDKATVTPARAVSQFTDAELRSLLQLVHPDKHEGKRSAVVLTQKINQLRA